MLRLLVNGCVWGVLGTIGFTLARIANANSVYGLIGLPILVWGTFEVNRYRHLRRWNHSNDVTKKATKTIDGPPTSFPDGNLISLIESPKPILEEIVDILEKKGWPDVMRISFGNVPTAVVVSSEAYAGLLINRNDTFIKGSMFQNGRVIVGDALFGAEGEVWKNLNKAIRSAFSIPNIRRIADEVFPIHTQILIDKWKEFGGEEFDLTPEIHNVTLDIIGESAFGYNINSQHNSEAAVCKALKYLITKSTFLALPGITKFPPFGVPLIQQAKVVDSLVYKMLDLFEQESLTGSKSTTKHNLLKLMENSKEFSREEMRDQTIGFILAGFETTATLISWVIVAIAQRPEIERQIIQELDSVLGGKKPTWDTNQQLLFLRAVIFETLRFYPPLSFFNRECTEDTNINGYFIPKGAIVWWSAHLLHRNPNVWENPNEFQPQRFLGSQKSHTNNAHSTVNHSDNGVNHNNSSVSKAEIGEKRDEITEETHKKIPPPTQLASFGAGHRICIGRFFAINETLTILAMIYQNFSVELVQKDVPPSKFSLTRTSKSGKIMVRLVPRKKLN